MKKKGRYLKDFYNTLIVLDSGLMSDKKSEAEEIFREIYSVQIIPKNKFEEFKKDIQEFIKTIEQGKENKRMLFTQFKRGVLSKYIVMHFCSKDLESVYNKLTIEIEMDSKWKRRLKRWLSGVYLNNDFVYNNEKGLIKAEEEKSIEDSFIL